MKKKFFILLLFVFVFLLTGCTSDYYKNKGDKYFATKDYENAEKYYLKALEKEVDSDIYIKLADLHRENHQYDKEIMAIMDGKNKLDESIDLDIRLAKYQAFVGNEDEARTYLKYLLKEKYDEEILKELFEIYLEYGDSNSIDDYYEEFKDKIKNLDTKILAYKAIRSDSNLRKELERELIDSKDIKAYEALIERFYNYREYEKVEELILKLNSMDDGLELSKIYSKLLTMKDLSVMGKQTGHFINMDKMDLVVMYNEDNSFNDIYLALIDGKTGEIVMDKKMEEFCPDSLSLYAYEQEGELDRLAIVSYYGMSATSGKNFNLYEFSKDDFKEIETNFESDLEIKLLEGFKIQIESKSLKTKYIIEIAKNDRLAYIEDGQYDENGIPIKDNGTRIYIDGYSLKNSGDYKDTISVLSGFGGAFRYSADRLGYIEELYNEINGSFKCTSFVVKNIDGMEKETKFVEGVRVITISEPEQVEETEETEEIEEIEEIYYPERLVEDDYKLLIGDKTIFVDNDIDNITKILGSGEVELVERINEDCNMYEYKKAGLTIVYIERNDPEGKQKFNDCILVDKPGIKTIRGLEVGIDEDKLEKLYGLKNLFYEDENESIYMYQEDEDFRFMDLFVVVDKKEKKVIRFNYSTNL
ncbi:tetratricopeptide repeat protein [Anaerosalibacter sp. Marseille-P3206]|uniref:tetratricopeptide repeat protein n=1 Tax=Anaerosalibacter sp. Marseille-P3206 TaxID=1871005 RepID=UPI0009876590|nr:tetratricopeptide repeat protein [Anaerosalibacter sp. Marseille-P3206]